MSYIAQICLGGLRWTPILFWTEACLTDIVYAVMGYCSDKGVSLKPSSKERPVKCFLDEMMNKFPDT